MEQTIENSDDLTVSFKFYFSSFKTKIKNVFQMDRRSASQLIEYLKLLDIDYNLIWSFSLL